MDWNGGKGQKKVEHGGVCYMLYVQNFLKSIPYSLSTLSVSFIAGKVISPCYNYACDFDSYDFEEKGMNAGQYKTELAMS